MNYLTGSMFSHKGTISGLLHIQEKLQKKPNRKISIESMSQVRPFSQTLEDLNLSNIKKPKIKINNDSPFNLKRSWQNYSGQAITRAEGLEKLRKLMEEENKPAGQGQRGSDYDDYLHKSIDIAMSPNKLI